MFVYKSEIAIIPGSSLIRVLEKENLTQKDLALKTGLTEKHISNIVQGKASITEDTAIKLEYVFGGKANFWINLQKNYDEDLARQRFKENLKTEEKLVQLYPVSFLTKLNFIPKLADKAEKLKELLKFFGVSSLKLVPDVQPVAYRKTAIKGKKIDGNALAAWLRIGELEFRKIEIGSQSLPEYDESLFKKGISEIKQMTKRSDCAEKLPAKLLEYGIVLVYSPYMPHTSVSGALRWFGGRPLIQLNDHLKAVDGFYFSLFHEFAHILLHDKRLEYIDYGQDEKEKLEKEADDWACETLINSDDYKKFLDNEKITVASVNRFAEQLEINRDIVIGRLAYDGKMSWKDRTRLVGKVTYSA